MATNIDVQEFIKRSREKKIPDEVTYKYLQQKGLVPAKSTSFTQAEGPEQPEEDVGFIKGLVRGIAKPVVTSVARPFQAVKSAIDYAKDPTKESKTSFNLPYLGKISGLEGEQLTGKNLAKVTGEALETASLAVPAGKVNIAGKAVSGLALGGATYGAGHAMAEGKGPGGVITDAVVGGVLGKAGEVGSKVLGKTLSYVGSRGTKLLGIVTGESDDVIKAALSNPKAADLGIKQGDAALRKAVSKGAEASIQAKEAFIKGHGEAFRKLAEKNANKLVNKSEIASTFQSILKNKGVKVGKSGVLDFKISPIKANPGEISKIEAAAEAIKNWKDFSLGGVNELKRLVGGLTRFADDAGVPSKSPTLGSVYNSLDRIIKKNLPPKAAKEYGKLNAKFASNIDLFDEMVDAFNKGDPFSKLANIFGKNKDSLRQVIDFYERQTGNKITPIVAGREIAMEKPAAFGFLNPRSWVDFFFSPSAQAKFVTGTASKVKTKAPPIGKFLQKLPEKIESIQRAKIPGIK